ncbi:1,3-beta-glucanosyltransferase gas1, partial [Mortierella sp. AD031]
FLCPTLDPCWVCQQYGPEIRLQVQDYFNCEKDDERVDFFGINLYEWYGEGTAYQTSGYVDRTADISSYSVPVFLSEYGCNLAAPHTSPEVRSIFGPDMTNTWSGGIVYEWSQEENNYGLAALSSIRPTGMNMDAFNEQRAPSACPATIATWEPSINLPLTPSSEACNCVVSSLSRVTSEQALSVSDSVGTKLNTLCGMTPCEHIGTDGKTGIHGKYSFCTPTQTRPSDEGFTAAPQDFQAEAGAVPLTKRGVVHASGAVSHQERSALGLIAMAA